MITKIKLSRLQKVCALILFFSVGPLVISTTNPESVPLPVLILPFLWIFFAVLILVRYAMRQISSVSNRQASIAAILFAVLTVMLLVFQSIHQLSIRDVLISVSIVVVAGVYLVRADFIK